MMFLRWISGLAIAGVAFVALRTHSWLWFAFLLLWLFVAALEWGRLTRVPDRILVLILLPASLICALELYYLLPIFLLVAAFPMLVNRRYDEADYPLSVGAGILWLSLPVALLFRLRLEFGFVTTFILVLGTALQDTAALYCGLWFGGEKKFAGEISPNKTWSGFLGSILSITLLFGVVGYFQLWPWSIAVSLVFGIFLGFIGTAGDLMVSGLKRSAGLKDTSNYFPGHGGILDRTDSLLMNVVFFYAALSLAGDCL